MKKLMKFLKRFYRCQIGFFHGETLYEGDTLFWQRIGLPVTIVERCENGCYLIRRKPFLKGDRQYIENLYNGSFFLNEAEFERIHKVMERFDKFSNIFKESNSLIYSFVGARDYLKFERYPESVWDPKLCENPTILQMSQIGKVESPLGFCQGWPVYPGDRLYRRNGVPFIASDADHYELLELAFWKPFKHVSNLLRSPYGR